MSALVLGLQTVCVGIESTLRRMHGKSDWLAKHFGGTWG